MFSGVSGGSQKKEAVKARTAVVMADKKPRYQLLKRRCLDQGVLFEDPEFPAEDSSLFFSQKPQVSFEWKRPHEIVNNPEFITGGASRTDICQGDLGDCWLLAAVASLTLDQKLLDRVVPPKQNFQENYAGIFHFWFWQYNEWVEVVVDDRLPTFRNRLVYLHSAEQNEFWSALLEKAYAKLNGNYESLKGGNTLEAMEDFTGGLGEMFDLNESSSDMYATIQKALQRRSMVGCSIDISSSAETEARTPSGLIKGHAYSVTGLQEIKYKGKPVRLIRVRNPWGQVEWNGAWSDNSAEWKMIDTSEHRTLNMVSKDDGEFWMAFEDFCKHFGKLEVCNLTPDSLYGDSTRKWNVSVYEGKWQKGSTAGGCRNFPETFWTNPQYKLRLHDADDGKNDSTLMIAILQKNRRKLRKEGVDLLTIGFAIYKAEPGDDHLPEEFFQFHASVARSKSYINVREICQRFQLPPGDYILVPTTFQPHHEADFVIRIFSEKKNESLEMGDKIGMDLPDPPTPSKLNRETEEERQFRKLFEDISGEDLEIDAYELQKILSTVFAAQKELATDQFDIETCRSIVSLYAKDERRMLGFEEFKYLWTRMKMWKTAFLKCDNDNSGTISSYELRSAIEEAGFQVNNQLIQLLVLRYANDYMEIYFDNFIRCLVRLETSFRSFMNFDTKKTGEISINMLQWLLLTMNI
uniref:Calpain 9 n=2 Tax=Callorhinchus milii TaxID=7868 RepID=A0A4W3HKS9_CALMI